MLEKILSAVRTSVIRPLEKLKAKMAEIEGADDVNLNPLRGPKVANSVIFVPFMPLKTKLNISIVHSLICVVKVFQ